MKWILIELLTNAVKHSGAERCELKITIKDKKLIIEKEDYGPPLTITDFDSGKKISWPLNQDESVNFQVYHNGSDSLRIKCIGNNEAIFFIDQLENQEMPGLLADISEHFGLLIITKASDGFKYEFDQDSKINRFTSHFNLK
ncbi:anti-sigma regulatory factor [Dyadobacter sp. NIV53]|uniref:anti-sigma regulatory factor n=1 Tax=Dyadobacter sp. NIV53 TaxID=2861765 RepID=UPI001C8704D6|nr:anti-sigma regulatory factor [Dyadobacter sp. NIV53]